MLSLFFCVFAITLALNVSGGATIGTTELSAVPNSRFQSKECGLAVKHTSYIFCDQDGLMKAEEKAEILKSIEETAEDLGLKFGVIVLNKMNTTGIKGDAAQHFASKLYKSHGMESLGVLIFISVKDKQMVLEKGSSAADLLPNAEVAKIVKAFKGKKPKDAIKGSMEKVLSYVDTPEAKDKLLARRWSIYTWIMGVSSAIIVVGTTYGLIVGFCNDLSSSK